MTYFGFYSKYGYSVRSDIIHSLKMKDPQVTIGSFDRANLFYGVKSFNRGPLFLNELVLDISKYVAAGGSTIIYCTTIKDVEQVYSFASHKHHFQVHCTLRSIATIFAYSPRMTIAEHQATRLFNHYHYSYF